MKAKDLTSAVVVLLDGDVPFVVTEVKTVILMGSPVVRAEGRVYRKGRWTPSVQKYFACNEELAIRTSSRNAKEAAAVEQALACVRTAVGW